MSKQSNYKEPAWIVGKESERSGKGDQQIGINQNYWFWAAEDPDAVAKKKSEKPSDSAVVGEDYPQEINEIIVSNPRMNASTLLNTLKSKGYGISKKAAPAEANEADSGSGFPGQQRPGAAVIKPKDSNQKQSNVGTPTFKFSSRFVESAASDNGIGPTKYKVVLLQEGLGNMEDGFYYSKSALESAVPIFEGKQFFADHPDAMEEKTRPERSVRDIVGWFEGVQVETDEDGSSMLTADAQVLPDPKYSWVRSLLTNSVSFSKKYPDKDLVGLSINASGPAEPVKLSEFIKSPDVPQSALPKLQKAAESGLDVVRLVQLFKEAVSCDLVTRAGARGRVLEILESEKEKSKMPKNPTKVGADMKQDEAEEKGKEKHEDGGDGGHADAGDDAELVKKMIKKHLPDHDDDSPEMKHASEAYQGYRERGHEAEEAAERAVEAMHVAKQMAAKRSKEAKKDDGDADDKKEDAKIDDKGYSYHEGKEKKESENEKKESEFLKLKGQVAKLTESLRKKEVAEYVEEKLLKSGLRREVTKAFRESIGSPRNEADVDRAFSLFLEGYKQSRAVGGSTVLGAEKTVHVGSGKVSFADCAKK